MPSFTLGYSSITAAARRCAAEWRKTNSASESFSVSIWSLTSWSSGRRRSISSPAPSLGAATRATSAASARRGEIPFAMSAGVVPLGPSWILPSGNVMGIGSMRFPPGRMTMKLIGGAYRGSSWRVTCAPASEEGDAGQLAEATVGSDQLCPKLVRDRVDECIGHGQLMLDTKLCSRKSYFLIDRHNGVAQSLRDEAVSGRFGMAKEENLSYLIENNHRYKK